MDILIIDNQTRYLEELKQLVRRENVQIVNPKKIDLLDINKFNLVILSGGHKFSVMNNEEKYAEEIKLIKTSRIPILGICLGFQLVARAFGGKLERLQIKRKGIIEIKILKKEPIFRGLLSFAVHEAHRWALRELPDDLVGLAKSKDGFEVIRHKDRMIYGFQFHPEMFIDKTCGDEIFYNFFNLIKQIRP